ncbi:MAG TPA: NfeD family protein [Candidatus Limnocylindrales bacterium]|nr:NfeD family protein [Candidatus Limnocylindrales bacterium]
MSEAGIAWWMWAIFGLVLAALELATPGGFYLLFFGIGALLVSFLTWGGMVDATLPQLLWFSVLSVVATVLFRRRLVDSLATREPEASDSMVGEVAVTLDDFDPDGFGKVELRGTAWSARNVGNGPLPRGHRCVVQRVEGLLLLVRPA